MIVHDRIYGQAEISEPVLLDLMTSAAIQRLHGVLQHGISGLIGITSPVSRYEHSIGVMLLSRQMGASLEEQVAALLHDVSHTAFSHVIDYVMNNHDNQGYHDDVKLEYVARTDLPGILSSHGYQWQDVLDEKAYAILEQPAPALCADRLDYFLRDTLDLGLSTLEACRQALAHLVVHEGRIMTDNLGVARWLAHKYIAADRASWADYREVGLYELTARAIRLAITLGVITEADFWSTDKPLWKKLHDSAVPELKDALALISPDTTFEQDEDNPEFTVSTKIRTIDPDIVVGGAVEQLSSLDSDFARYRAEYVSSKSGAWPYRVIRP